jgi:HlyD family secretion protein
MILDHQKALSGSLRRHAVIGTTAIVLLVGGIGGWAATTELSGAVIASGILVVEGNTKKIQHPTGGVVAELLVAEGQHVMAGDVLLRLDATVTRANLAVIGDALNQLYVRQARLEAERDGLPTVDAPKELAGRLTAEEVETAMARERRLFVDRRIAREGQKTQLREQIAQLREQINGLAMQQQAKTEEIALIEKELEGVRTLFAKELTPLTRMNNLDREAVRLRGERGQLIGSIASARGKIAEIEQQLLQIDQTMRSEVAAELRDTVNKQAELAEKKIAAEDALTRTVIRSPISGAVHQLSVHTIGGVVGPGEELMQIVPLDSNLTLEARIAPQDIDQVSIGQTATLRLSAFNRTTTPELSAKVIRVSADLEVDTKTGASFYRVAIAIPQAEVARLAGLTLMPGMPVETFIQTGQRTALSYLMKPITDHAARIFREE